MHYPIEQHAATIVLIGSFNPAIFSPGWLAHIDVISEDAFQNAAVEIIHPDIAKFSIDRFSVEILNNRFSINTRLEPFERILDDVLKIFNDHLVYTPLLQLGINYEATFKVKSFRQRNALGRALAPVEPWGAYGKRMESKEEELTGGLASLTMKEFPREDRKRGYRQVTIEPWHSKHPSPKLQTGVRMRINDHFETTEQQAIDAAKPILAILEEAFESSMDTSRSIVSEIIDYAGSFE